MQLARATGVALIGAALSMAAPAAADDSVNLSTTWFQESRNGPLGGLTIIHPQFDAGVDLGDHTSLAVRYASDIVTGATASVYSVDAVSSATKFSDTRNDVGLSLGLFGARSRLALSVGTAAERDYVSLNFGGSGAIDLPGKNTNIALSYTHNMDAVCDRENANTTPFERQALIGGDPCTKSFIKTEDSPGMTAWRDLSIDTTQVTLTQNFTPTVVGQFTLFGQVLKGFQSNPYRRVRVRGLEAQENVPNVRARIAGAIRINKYLPDLKAAVQGSIRGYSDTWEVNSATVEMAWSQYAGRHLLFRFRMRAYQQDQANFFKDAFFYDTEGAAGQFFTGDRELGALRHLSPGAKMSYIAFSDDGAEVWGLFDEVRFNLKGDALFYKELNADSAALNPEGIDRQFLGSNQFLDGFVLHLSLMTSY